jgi:hypothetical protein
MSRYDTLRYEMFLRVSEFGKSHRQQFPESSPAGQAFAAVEAAAAKFDTHVSARRLAGEDSRKVKANVSRAIRRRLTLVNWGPSGPPPNTGWRPTFSRSSRRLRRFSRVIGAW